jgi:HAD superfamily hydrolase (TIGR01549 family)
MRRAEVLFLDFDGPVCDLFAGVPASVVADQLCVVLADSGHNDLPPDVEKSSDPFDVLNYAAKLGQAEADHVNAAFTAHEVEAIATAAPTPGAHDLIRKWSRTGRRLAIVSNNSRSAVDAYLDLHRLRQQVSFVSARVSADPALLKPSPHLVEAALASLVVRSSEVVFIGDSLSDLIAARDATVTFVGYANRAYKIESFTHQLALTTTDLTRVLSVG